MNSGYLHKRKPEIRRIDASKKNFLRRFRVLEFFSTTRNDRMFLSSRALKKYYISMNSCILINCIIKQSKIRVSVYSKKSLLCRFRVLKFFLTTWNDRIFLSSKVHKKYFISKKLCILSNYTRKQPKIRVSMSSKKVCCVRFGFSNFFRLLETIEFFFF